MRQFEEIYGLKTITNMFLSHSDTLNFPDISGKPALTIIFGLINLWFNSLIR
jgi:hypothetical protein